MTKPSSLPNIDPGLLKQNQGYLLSNEVRAGILKRMEALPPGSLLKGTEEGLPAHIHALKDEKGNVLLLNNQAVLGSGGFGEVIVAQVIDAVEGVEEKTFYAVKRQKVKNAVQHENILRENKIGAILEINKTQAILQPNTKDEQIYSVMELLEGEDLSNVMMSYALYQPRTAQATSAPITPKEQTPDEFILEDDPFADADFGTVPELASEDDDPFADADFGTVPELASEDDDPFADADFGTVPELASEDDDPFADADFGAVPEVGSEEDDPFADFDAGEVPSVVEAEADEFLPLELDLSACGIAPPDASLLSASDDEDPFASFEMEVPEMDEVDEIDFSQPYSAHSMAEVPSLRPNVKKEKTFDDFAEVELQSDVADFKVAQALSELLSMAKSLDNVHNKGVLHLDFKPENVRRAPDGTMRVMDTGLSKIKEEGPLPSPNAFSCGTPLFMAPEYHNPNYQEPLSEAQDVYAFGRSCEMLLNQQLIAALGQEHVNKAYAVGQVKCANPQNDAQIEAINGILQVVHQARAEDPQARPSMQQITQQLNELQTQLRTKQRQTKEPGKENKAPISRSMTSMQKLESHRKRQANPEQEQPETPQTKIKPRTK